MDGPGLLLIAHGTREPRGAEEMAVLGKLVRTRLDVPVGHAWIEDFASPGAVEAAGELAAQGVSRLVVLPFLVLAAGHARYDIPERVAAIRAAFPDVEVAVGEVLGLQPALFELARTRVEAVAGTGERDGEALLVTGAGSSDADANGDLAKAARVLAEGTGHRLAEIAFAGVSWPTADVALRRLHAAGATRVVRFSWSLLAGVLEARVTAWADTVAVETGLAVLDAGRFGPHPLVADAVAVRYRLAVQGCVR